MKEKIGKILIFVSAALAILSFVTLFLPAYQLKFVDYFKSDEGGIETETLIGTGSVTSLFAIMLRLACTVTFNPVKGASYSPIVDRYKMNTSATLPARIQFIVIVVLVLLAIAILILLLTGKFKGKLKVILSICFWVLLVAVAGSALLEKALADIKVGGEIAEKIAKPLEEQGHTLYIRQSALGLAPILLAISTASALVTNVIGSVLNRDK